MGENMNARDYRRVMADKENEIELNIQEQERLNIEIRKRDYEFDRVRLLKNCGLVLLGVLLVIAVAL